MGCDIHMYHEEYIDGEWVTHHKKVEDIYPDGEVEKYLESMGRPSMSRNYLLFGHLAGVRRQIPNSREPRGLPDDLSPEIKEEFEKWEDEYHSNSWITMKEIKEDLALLLIQPYEGSKHVAEGLKNILDYVSDMKDASKHRIVFWFDN